MKRKIWKFETQVVALSGGLTALLLVFLFLIKGIAPFGTKSFVSMDANIQYLDFFSYFKDVLSGKNSIMYTFGKTLGGSNVAVFSYYLASPFNLLLTLFDHMQLHTFFDLIVALKIIMSAIAFAYFVVHRFEEKEKQNLVIFVLISIGYGMCQYNIAQSSNIMWLDGVYLLPFILLQVYYVVKGKKVWKLSVLVGVAIVFNWYSAGINCLFTAIWFLFELCMIRIEKKISLKKIFKISFGYILAMLWGVMLSSFLFLPTINALRKSSRGSLHITDLLDISLIGEIPSAFQKYSYGAVSELGSVALFCGSLSIILAIFCLCNRDINIWKRVVLGGLLLSTLLLFYWRPLFFLFSLFQWSNSYNYRYSYVAVFVILFLATYGNCELKGKHQLYQLLKIAVVYSLSLILLFYVKPVNSNMCVYATACAICIISIIYTYYKYEAQQKKNTVARKLMFILVIVISMDYVINAELLINVYSRDAVVQYQQYRTSQEKLISYIKDNDDSFYRISQTSNRGTGENGLTANYNEALSYNYASLSGYTSSPDDNQREFLDKVGYPINGVNMCVTNTSIIGADSLLGVRYILSSYDIEGLERIKSAKEGEKSIYCNPYAFPIAFTYDEKVELNNMSVENPFEYQNSLYKQLFGIKKNLYTPLQYTISTEEDLNEFKVDLNMPSDLNSKYVIYGSIPWNTQMGASIYIDGKYITDYACWLSPTVFYIANNEQSTCEIEVKAGSLDFKMDSMQFYALNLNVLDQCAKIANRSKVDDISIKNGYVEARVADGEKGERLFISVPEDDGWKISINGEKANIKLVGDCLYSIELVDGVNELRMKYQVSYLKEGILTSSIALLFLLMTIRNKRNR